MKLPPLARLRATRARRHLADFVRQGWHVVEPATPLVWNWHLDALCLHVQALLEDAPGTPQNLLINIPPGTCKSLVLAVFAPAWMWLHRPGWRALFASGSPRVVTRDSLRCRSIVRSDWYRQTFSPEWDVSSEQDEKHLFANTAGGWRSAVGAGSSVTGDRADFLAVDDANDAKEIHSRAHRVAINENWWDMAWHNRIADPQRSKRAVIMQRLHEEDLAGHLLEHERGEWAHLCIPMEWDAKGPGDKPTWLGWSDPRGADGELMFPARFNAKFLAGERLTLGTAGYSGQMQQQPAPSGGGMFQRKWWRFWSENGGRVFREGAAVARPRGCSDLPPRKLPEKFDRVTLSVDATFKDTKTADFVCVGKWGFLGADRFLLRRTKERLSYVATKELLRVECAIEPVPQKKLIEDKANGPAIINELRSEIPGLVAFEPHGSKEARAASITPLVEAGNVYLPEGADWLEDYVGEMAMFPYGRNDDQVDMTSQALIDGGKRVVVL